ncbi:hypothetical protein Tdes44962_MAKER00116 [Teratosphaeria destructans]|uniref:Uncharacterized protein n=1 Tax=Teratosphaeria destructans TaxID=418781 RepID=A0A9W7T382_9PEZI|nr:hypothetical protein Tdes44962_MAKER00116 [Teratosphaeria destructans]
MFSSTQSQYLRAEPQPLRNPENRQRAVSQSRPLASPSKLRRSSAVRHDATRRPTYSEDVNALATSYQAVSPLDRLPKKYALDASDMAEDVGRHSTAPFDPYTGLVFQRLYDVSPRRPQVHPGQRRQSLKAEIVHAIEEDNGVRPRYKVEALRQRHSDGGGVRRSETGRSDSVIRGRRSMV